MVGVLRGTDRPSGAPARAGLSPVDLHQLPPIYRLTYGRTDSGARIHAARQQLVGGCMARHGFAYPTAPAAPAAGGEELWPFPFGLESLAQGGGAEKAPQPAEERRGEPYVRALYGDPEKRLTARGGQLEVSRPATGCLAEADRRLLGDGQIRRMQLTLLLHEAEQTARNRLDQDAAFRELTARWQRCMTGAGFPAPDPRQLMRSLPAGAGTAAAPAAEADIRCKREVDYLPAAYTGLARYQQEILDGEPSLARDWAMLQERQDTVARSVLEPGPGASSAAAGGRVAGGA
ncbi:hypothetical protein [Micromonospora sp. I033]